jgi:hypothetical protein
VSAYTPDTWRDVRCAGISSRDALTFVKWGGVGVPQIFVLASLPSGRDPVWVPSGPNVLIVVADDQSAINTVVVVPPTHRRLAQRAPSFQRPETSPADQARGIRPGVECRSREDTTAFFVIER